MSRPQQSAAEHDGSVVFHDVVVTAANEAQATGYRAELDARERLGRLPRGTTFHVIADPGGRRVGSGAATLVVIERLAKLYRTTPAKLADERRVLILHSGGDSRRLPAYAASGKLFVPLPRTDEQGRGLTLFDLLLADVSTPRLGDGGRVVVAAGDVYLSLASQKLDLSGADVVGVALRGGTTAGARHGVYAAGADGRVLAFLQKPSVEEAERAGAIGADGTLLLDSGIVSLSPQAVGSLVRAARAGGVRSLLRGVLGGKVGLLDFYEHVLIGVYSSRSPRAYADTLAEPGSEAHARLEGFKAALPGLCSRVIVAEKSRFVHIGTTRELVERLGSEFGDAGADRKRVVFNSGVRGLLAVHGRAVVEGSVLRGVWSLRGDNVLVGVPGELTRGLTLPRGVGAVFLPVGRLDWAVLLFGVSDDFKSPLGADGPGTFLNTRAPGESLRGKTLWDAAVWRVGTLGEALAHALELLESPSRLSTATGLRTTQQVIAAVNYRRLHATRIEAERLARLESIQRRLDEHEWMPASLAAADVRTQREAAVVAKQLDRAAEAAPSHSRAARAYYLKAAVLRQHGSALAAKEAAEQAFARVRESVNHAVARVEFPRSPAVLRDQVVWATCPARLDFAGGWTDTPPICTDVGGMVVNAAVTLNGQYPLQAICRLTDEPTIRLSSIDLGKSVTFRSTSELLRVGDPSDWAALPKAALLLTGFVPAPTARGTGATLRKHLERFGAGLDVTLFSALPKGSGLGSSSILGATLIAALLRVLDARLASTQSIIDLTSQLEQIMSTGGGWQDQAGGTTPGVKLVTSMPGPTQHLAFSAVPEGGVLGTPDARERCLLYYTGKRRLAKNILRNVIGGYLGREARVRGVLERLKAGALRLDEVLRQPAGSLDEVGACVTDYWLQKKAIDPGSSTAEIEAMFDAVRRDLSGGTILGAGGGGFALLIARDARAARRIQRTLNRGSGLARFYDFAIDRQGLGVSVL